jgi:signal transducing adaptor molecule
MLYEREISSRTYLDCLQKLLTGKSHITIKNRILELIQTWATDFNQDPSLSYMVEVFNQLKSMGMDFPTGGIEGSPVRSKAYKESNADKEKEEEDFQLALALSLSQQQQKLDHNDKQSTNQGKAKILFSVRALFEFNGSEEGELAIKEGDIIQVHDCTTFPDWWMGTLNGIHGIFPANYVEKIATEFERERDREISVLSQIQRVRKLSQAISNADPLGNNHVENDRLAVYLFYVTLARISEYT